MDKLRKLKELLYWLIIIPLLFLAGLYYINFEIKGDTGFITTTEATAHRNPSYNSQVITSYEFGDSVTILNSGYAESNSFVKVRIEELGKRPKIGYIPSNSVSQYVFPDLDSAVVPYLILCDQDISLDEFVPKFTEILEERRIIGIYFVRNNLEESNLSDLENFCISQKIPWGTIRDLSENSVFSAEDAYYAYTKLSPLERFEDYRILTDVFDITSNYNQNLTEDISIPYVLFSSNRDHETLEEPLWLNFDAHVGSGYNKKESIYASTQESDEAFSYAVPSDDWAEEIEDAYETAREEAAE